MPDNLSMRRYVRGMKPDMSRRSQPSLSDSARSHQGRPTAALPAAQALLTFSKTHDIALYAMYGEIFSAWANGRINETNAGLDQLREAVADFLALGNKNAAPTFYGLVGDLEARRGHMDCALRSFNLALLIAEENGEHWTDSMLLRRKGEILLNRDSSNVTAAEEALRAAIAVAKRQDARSYKLVASLSLARLYQSIDRPIEAHDLLASALDGFSTTPEMPEIAEAQALRERLA